MGLYLIIITYIIILFYLLVKTYDRILPNHWSLWLKSKYATVFSIVVNQINMNKGQMFFPLLSSLFI